MVSLSRRGLGAAAVAAGASGLLAPAAPGKAAEPATFVLVHGAWHGGWCYARVAKLLRARGHTVFTPTLTGLADRSHLFGGNINLSTHVTDVLNVIRWEGLENIVLCGHSYGGMVITGVATAAADKIAAIVYLDAFLPGDNQSIFDLGDPGDIKDSIAAASTRGGIGLPPIPAADFGVNPADRAWVDSLCTPQPLGTFTEKNRSAAGLSTIRRKHYILATGYLNGGLFKWAFDKVRTDLSWTTEIVTCGHDVMLDQPRQLADRLAGFAG
jgi:pimeloyl-ACP methyl ester carboxylesterase